MKRKGARDIRCGSERRSISISTSLWCARCTAAFFQTHGCPQNSHVARRSKDPAFTDTVSCELRIGLQCAQQNTCLVLAIAQCFMRVIMLSQQDLWEQAHAVWRKDSMQYLWCFPPAYLHSVHCAIILFHLMSIFYVLPKISRLPQVEFQGCLALI